MDDLETQDLIRTHTAAVVPLLIRELEAQGGITEIHLSYISNHASYLGAHGDELQYLVKGETAKAMDVLCEGLAVLAFAPGGIKFAGQHFEGLPTMCFEDVQELKTLQEVLV